MGTGDRLLSARLGSARTSYRQLKGRGDSAVPFLRKKQNICIDKRDSSVLLRTNHALFVYGKATVDA